MKNFLIGMFAGACMLFTPSAYAGFDFSDFDFGVDNFEFNQHDFSATTGSLTFSGRVLSGDADYWHLQGDLALRDDLLVGVRYADIDGLIEYRAHAAWEAYRKDWFYVMPILSYHYYDGGELIRSFVNSQEIEYRGPDTTDFFRLGVRVGADHAFNDNWTGFVWHEPRFTFAGDSDGFDFAGTKSELGVLRNMKGFQFGPFLQLVTDDSYEKDWLIAGTKVSLRF